MLYPTEYQAEPSCRRKLSIVCI